MAISTAQGKKGDRRNKPSFNEINITPLTDIFLVLLIIMMVLAPMFQSSQAGIHAPKLLSGQAIEDNKVKVEITQKGRIFVNSKATAIAALGEQLKRVKPASQESIVVVKADAQTKNDIVLKVYQAASQAGYQKMTLSGEPIATEAGGH
jgi:biopolymer transport protein ExbD